MIICIMMIVFCVLVLGSIICFRPSKHGGSKLRSRIPESVEKCVRFLDSFYYYETISKVNALLTTSLGEPHLNKKWSLAFSKTLVYTTLIILISEGDIKFPYASKLVSQKDLGSIVHFGIIR